MNMYTHILNTTFILLIMSSKLTESLDSLNKDWIPAWRMVPSRGVINWNRTQQPDPFQDKENYLSASNVSDISRVSMDTTEEATARKKGIFGLKGKKKKLTKYMLPLLLAYKLKYFTLIPVLVGGLVLLTGSTGLAGFFFAMFAAVLGLKTGHGH